MIRTLVFLSVVLCSAGCRTRPDLIAVPDDTVPHRLEEGEPSPGKGWWLSDATMVELAPLMRAQLEDRENPAWQNNQSTDDPPPTVNQYKPAPLLAPSIKLPTDPPSVVWPLKEPIE